MHKKSQVAWKAVGLMLVFLLVSVFLLTEYMNLDMSAENGNIKTGIHSDQATCRFSNTEILRNSVSVRIVPSFSPDSSIENIGRSGNSRYRLFQLLFLVLICSARKHYLESIYWWFRDNIADIREKCESLIRRGPPALI